MLLEELLAVIETIQRRIREHGPTLRENETRTRLALIDPLLQALGWDVSDPAVVTPEYNAGNGRADYALMSGGGRPSALIEAKHLAEPLERTNHQEQVFTYALMQQVRYAGLTDGDRWILDDVSVFSGERRLLDVSLANTPAHECALRLLLLWRPNLASGRPVAAEEPLFRAPPAPLPATPATLEEPAVIETPRPISSEPVPTQTGGVLLSSYQRGEKPPAAIRFSDGAEHPIRLWRHLVEHTAAWLWSIGKLNQGNLPVSTGGRRRYIVNSIPVHPDGRPFHSPCAVAGTPLFYEGNIGGQTPVIQTIALLRHCGIDPGAVQLQVGQ